MSSAQPSNDQARQKSVEAARIAVEMLELAAESDRAAFVRRRCRADASLMADVLSLVALAESEPGFMARPLVRLPEIIGAVRGLAPGTRVGPYRVVSLLGSGGMADVYEVHPDGEPQAERVALKLMRPDAAVSDASDRFRREVETLSRLDHPGIARLVDAGVFESEEGARLYCAMELVRGIPITEHAAEAALDLRQRLGLFLRVCAAVAHAHCRGVIHRDIKPSNVLVTGEERVKVLDFGVSKSVALDSIVVTLTGSPGALVGTLAYMSPEQAWAEEPIDVRCDVYALGVLLFELLAGHLPRDPAKQSIPEFFRQLRDEEAPPIRRVAPLVPEDVASILAKAMHRDRGRRYTGVDDLAADIGRFLRAEPIDIRRLDLAYLFGREARRRPLATGAVCALAIAVVAGVPLVGWQAYRAIEAERKRLEDARAVVREIVNTHMSELHRLPGSTKARRLWAEQAVAIIDRLVEGGAVDPESRSLQIAALTQLGRVSGGTGDATDGDDVSARASLERAIALAEALLVDFPDDDGFRQQLAQVLFLRAFAGGDQSRCDETAERAGSIWRELAQRHPEQLGSRMSAAYTLVRSGLDQGTRGEHPTDSDRALEEYTQLAREYGNTPEIRLGIGMARRWRAEALQRVGEPAWEDDARAGAEVLGSLLQEGVSNDSVVRHLAHCEGLIGLVEARRGNIGEALARAARSGSLVRNLLKSDPTNSLWRTDTALVLSTARDIRLALADWEGASAEERAVHLREAIAILDEMIGIVLQDRETSALSESEKFLLSSFHRSKAEVQEHADALAGDRK
ncbi:eukaryotic-like serine/threonine-protein kinase [Phycisphaerales bacterium]|nr:eukaryotic-like serine/threonine-protein kinase [Phycisphaerales bacterium]